MSAWRGKNKYWDQLIKPHSAVPDGTRSRCHRNPPMNRWAIVFRADGADTGSFERGEDFGNGGADTRLKAALRGLGQFFAERNRFAGGMLSLRRVMERAELASRSIAFHLLVSLVILEGMQ